MSSPTPSLIYFIQLQLDRISKALNPKIGHVQGPRKPSLSQQESTPKK